MFQPQVLAGSQAVTLDTAGLAPAVYPDETYRPQTQRLEDSSRQIWLCRSREALGLYWALCIWPWPNEASELLRWTAGHASDSANSPWLDGRQLWISVVALQRSGGLSGSRFAVSARRHSTQHVLSAEVKSRPGLAVALRLHQRGPRRPSYQLASSCSGSQLQPACFRGFCSRKPEVATSCQQYGSGNKLSKQ